ncbi:hypothetical protein [Streptomyces sp. Isolate_219]|uniref:hypothetical protein n=1 Tax=Streptomyces sp. Isolate_219 TaxID=2950110 RepID=UPI0021C86B9B|nr:hypothetical protein [Streptomyces sp. Isolate_219]MCR8576352.1 hypothetical protein [Streptomyces sp. Isolate_219]
MTSTAPRSCPQTVDKYGTTLVPAGRQQVKDLATGIKNKSITHQAGAARPTGWDNFAQVYIWLPGNLFTGPKNRADDPGDQFDAAVRFIIGAGCAQYTTLQTVNGKIGQYAKDRKKTGYAEEAYTSLGTVARSYLNRTPFSGAETPARTSRRSRASDLDAPHTPGRGARQLHRVVRLRCVYVGRIALLRSRSALR